MIEDKKTVGLTPTNRAIMEEIFAKGLFHDQKDIAKFAMAFAINQGIPPGNVEGSGTVWNTGSLDEGSEIRNLILTLFPGNDAPYRMMEGLINAGLSAIAEVMKSDPSLELMDLMTMRPKDTTP